MMISAIVSRLIFYPTLSFNYLMTIVSNRKWYNRIDNTVVIGALPVKWIANQLIEEENIGGIISLNEEYEMKLMYSSEGWNNMKVEQLKIPMVDFVGAPAPDDFKKSVEFICKHKNNGKSVYVHCKAGRTRSASVVACYLMEKNKWSPEKAIDFIKQKRQHIVLRQPQYKALHEFDRLYEHRQ